MFGVENFNIPFIIVPPDYAINHNQFEILSQKIYNIDQDFSLIPI